MQEARSARGTRAGLSGNRECKPHTFNRRSETASHAAPLSHFLFLTFTIARNSGLSGARRKCFGGSFLHFFSIKVLLVCAYRPAMSKRIGQDAITVSPEHVRYGHPYGRACMDGTLCHSVDVVHVQIDRHACAASRRRRHTIHSRKLIS